MPTFRVEISKQFDQTYLVEATDEEAAWELDPKQVMLTGTLESDDSEDLEVAYVEEAAEGSTGWNGLELLPESFRQQA